MEMDVEGEAQNVGVRGSQSSGLRQGTTSNSPLTEPTATTVGASSSSGVNHVAATITTPTSVTSNITLDGYKQDIEEKCLCIAKLEEKIRLQDSEIAGLTALPDWREAGDSQLHLAVSQNDIKTVRAIIQNGTDLNATNDNRETPLHTGAKAFRNETTLEIIKTLIEGGSDPFLEDNSNRTFLPYLTDNNGAVYCTPAMFHQIVAYLLKKNKDFIRLFNASMTLELAVKNMDLEEATLKLLHANGLNFKAFSDDNNIGLVETAVAGERTPAFLATLVKFLLKMDIVDLQYIKLKAETILFYVAARGDSKALKYFLRLGLDNNVVDTDDPDGDDGDTLLHCALKSWKGNVLEAAQIMILEGVNPKMVNKAEETPLHNAAEFFTSDVVLDVIELLIESGADAFQKQRGLKFTFLHTLISNPNVSPSLFHEVVVYLTTKKYLELFNKVDEYGNTPLDLAIDHLDLEARTLTILEAHGILQPEKLTSVKTMSWLERIVLGGNVKALQFLISKLGLEVNTQEEYSENSPLHQAALFGQKNMLRIVQTLINAGANVDLKNKGGLTPLDIVMTRENMAEKGKVVHLLMNGTLPVPIHDIVNGVETQVGQSIRLISGSIETSVVELLTSEYSTTKDFEDMIEPAQSKLYKETIRMKNDSIKKLDEEVQAKKRKLERLNIIKLRNVNWDTELHLAVSQGDQKAVKELIRDGAPVNATNKRGDISLHKVAECKDDHFSNCVGIINCLLENEADIFARNNDNITALCAVIIRRGESLWTPEQFHKIVKVIVEQNMVQIFNSPCEGLGSKVTPFQWALAMIDVKEETLSLLRNYVDFEATDVDPSSSFSILSYAINRGRRNRCKRGSCHDSPFAAPPFQWTLGHGYIDVKGEALPLLRNYADLNDLSEGGRYKPFSVLLDTISNGRSLRDVENIVKFGADPHFVNSHHQNMLHIATGVKFVNLDLLKYLLKLGLDINAIDTEEGTPLHYAVRGKWEETGDSSEKLVQFLITNGANADLSNYAQQTPLLLAAKEIGNKDSSIAVIKYLIKNGANPFTEVEPGQTFLYELVNSTRPDSPFSPSLFRDFVQYLVENDYSELLHTRKEFEEGEDGGTEESMDPLEVAVTKGILAEDTLFYLETHEQLAARDQSQCRLLHLAAKHARLNVLKFLVALKWDTDTRDAKGLTPLQFALSGKNLIKNLSESVKILLEAGADKTVKQRGRTILEMVLRNGNRKYLKKEFDKIVALLQ